MREESKAVVSDGGLYFMGMPELGRREDERVMIYIGIQTQASSAGYVRQILCPSHALAGTEERSDV